MSSAPYAHVLAGLKTAAWRVDHHLRYECLPMQPAGNAWIGYVCEIQGVVSGARRLHWADTAQNGWRMHAYQKICVYWFHIKPLRRTDTAVPHLYYSYNPHLVFMSIFTDSRGS